MGYAFQPKLRNGELCSMWSIKYYDDGRPVKEATHTTSRTEALRILKEREGRVARGEVVAPRVDRVKYEEAAADLRSHYAAMSTRDLSEHDRRGSHLARFLAGRRIATIGQPDVTAYIEMRKGQGVGLSTCRRELVVLTKLMHLAYENGKLQRMPKLKRPADGTPRQGFFELEQYHAVLAQLPADLQVATNVMHTYGWRKMEVLNLERRQLDLVAGTLRLDMGSTKNDEGRTVVLTPELVEQLTAHVARVKELERQLGRIIPYLFPHFGSSKRAGSKRSDYRGCWESACAAAGVAGRTRHDLRRTAVRNMEQRGVSRSVAMKLTGHKTEGVYARYAIVSPADLRAAAAKLSNASQGAIGGTIAAVSGVAARRFAVESNSSETPIQ